MTQHYVYGLFRPDTGGIFYIGMGQGDRAWAHVKNRRRGKSYKDNLICKLIDDLGYPEIPVVFFREKVARQEAIDLEIALIYAIGRHPHGPLTNIVKGGEGLADPTPEFREKHGQRMREVLADPDIRAVMSAKAKARPREGTEWEQRRQDRMGDPDVRKKLSAAKKGKPSAKAGKTYGPSEQASIAQSQLRWITNEIEDTRIPKTDLIPPGWRPGRRKLVDDIELARRAEEKQANREAWLERNRNRRWVTDGKMDLAITKDDPIPKGFRSGRMSTGPAPNKGVSLIA